MADAQATLARRLATGLLLMTLTACTPLAVNESRAAKSSLGCMRAALSTYDFGKKADDQLHCIAAGLIARRCSVTEARVASYGKEFRDLFGIGNAEWRDLKSDRQGIACAQTTSSESQLFACCTR